MGVPGRRLPLLLATAVAGCVMAGTVTAPSQAADATTAEQVAVPQLQWGECDDGFLDSEPAFDCATASVPLDYADPTGATIDLALKRRRADDQEQRIGSLFVNPGGPGGSGVDFVSAVAQVYGPEVLARFDIIGFDPRGVARSAPLVCFDNDLQLFETFAYLPAFPLTGAEEKQFVDSYSSYTGRCAAKAEPILDHMSTGNVARDLDLLRAAVGDDKLTYAGYSYGTQIGTTYANMYPANVRALVLDGVIDPVAWTTGANVVQGGTVPYSIRDRTPEGSYATLQQFFATCAQAGPGPCVLDGLGDPGTVYATLAERLKQDPVFVPLGYGMYQRFGYAELVSITQSAMYDPTTWPFLAQLVVDLDRLSAPEVVGKRLEQVRQHLGLDHGGVASGTVPSGAGVVGGAVSTRAADPEPGGDDQFWQTVEGTDGVACLDSDNPPTVLAWPVAAAAADHKAPYFGRSWTWSSLACATWPGKDTGRYTGPWTATTANPVLIVGNTYDPATPYFGAERVARLLPSSRLLTLDASGHTAVAKSKCIDAAVGAYLVSGALPPKGTVCEADTAPFEVVPDPVAAREAARQQIIAANLSAALQH